MQAVMDAFRPKDPEDFIEVFLMNAAKEYCISHPEAERELNSVRDRNIESMHRMNEQSLKLICEIL